MAWLLPRRRSSTSTASSLPPSRLDEWKADLLQGHPAALSTRVHSIDLSPQRSAMIPHVLDVRRHGVMSPPTATHRHRSRLRRQVSTNCRLNGSTTCQNACQKACQNWRQSDATWTSRAVLAAGALDIFARTHARANAEIQSGKHGSRHVIRA